MNTNKDSSMADCTSQVISPLSGKTNVRERRRISVQGLIDRWENELRIDISNELRGVETINEYECLDTGLLFYYPPSSAGSSELYENLSAYPWYYIENKWEHRAVLPLLSRDTKFLEIGCGRGAFLCLAAEQRSCRGIGLEMNERAAGEGRSLGLAIECAGLADFAAEHDSQFDLVCAFQVLEHVSALRQFINAAIDLTKPGGRVIFSVPNAKSLLGCDAENLLDMPPHHMTRWGRQPFLMIPHYFSLRLMCIRKEPLASYHAMYYVSRLASEAARYRIPFVNRGRIKSFAGSMLQRSRRLRLMLTGHTHMACYEKLSVDRC